MRCLLILLMAQSILHHSLSTHTAQYQARYVSDRTVHTTIPRIKNSERSKQAKFTLLFCLMGLQSIDFWLHFLHCRSRNCRVVATYMRVCSTKSCINGRIASKQNFIKRGLVFSTLLYIVCTVLYGMHRQ